MGHRQIDFWPFLFSPIFKPLIRVRKSHARVPSSKIYLVPPIFSLSSSIWSIFLLRQFWAATLFLPFLLMKRKQFFKTKAFMFMKNLSCFIASCTYVCIHSSGCAGFAVKKTQFGFRFMFLQKETHYLAELGTSYFFPDSNHSIFPKSQLFPLIAKTLLF